ncbi:MULTISPECIES: hypothetical protein [Lysobacter]|uniref:hypothetical protein n=1 Tax=Lysobacter TaxID=68 RepID=UPI001F400B5C|nr:MULTISPECIES: hypothetical protein [Lysobacter]UJB19219.1 hypothetical protein L1A79_23390 [Lysobacter capsici]UJQ27056.1 hypothetical protein L2D09_16495 [Lysobacter gummosus]
MATAAPVKVAAILGTALALASFLAQATEIPRIIEAARIATIAFSQDLPRRYQAPNNSDAAYLRNIDNYDIGLSQNTEAYIVLFRVRDRNFSGGGADYRISKTDLKITKVNNHF